MYGKEVINEEISATEIKNLVYTPEENWHGIDTF